ncbi:MAG: RNA polymerase sigma factor [Acidobacteria bacterium]|jgi:RNA polymerase sigma-70 factor (ECF subfamily)|nr:RNA polymerase sigma factor [Acidobacteriota bacterium]MCU0253581.1 RNA polymerase sigma factor [Acidobacteriota bacterium]
MTDRTAPIEDEWLVLRSQEGDDAAFERLIARWQPRLWRHARRLVADDDDAWDALQEAWISMLAGLRRLHDPAAFPAWAYRIVTFKCADAARRAGRERRTERGAAVADTPRYETGRDEIEALRRALHELTLEQRAILSLHYMEELGVERIAEILGIPAGTVKSRLHHARAALAQRLGRRTS